MTESEIDQDFLNIGFLGIGIIFILLPCLIDKLVMTLDRRNYLWHYNLYRSRMRLFHEGTQCKNSILFTLPEETTQIISSFI